ncbi:MAG: MarR family winged helix-turn-helix transcriptional regulator [Acidimicrobiales bacterium]
MATARTAPGAPSTGRTAIPDAPGGVAAPSDQDLAARVRVAVTRLNRRLRQQALAGLSPAKATALGSIHRLGSPTLGELALAEQVQPPTMTRLVAAMEEAGLVARMADAEDGRVFRVRLTGEGRRTLERIRTMKTAYLTRRFAALEPHERASLGELTALLERLVEHE